MDADRLPIRLRFLISLFITLLIAVGASAQPPDVDRPADAEPVAEAVRNTRSTLNAIIESAGRLEADLKVLEELRSAASSQKQKERITKDIEALSERLKDMERDFEKIATGVDLAAFEEAPDGGFDWKKELQMLLGPLVHELRSLTDRPRQVEALRRELAAQKQQLAIIEKAIRNIETLLAEAEAESLKTHLEQLKKNWLSKQQHVTNQLTIAEYQLEDLEKEKKSLFESSQQLVRSFFKSRGRNLAVAALAFLLVFLLLRWSHRLIERLSPVHTAEDRPFYVRLFDVGYIFLTFLGATGAALLVLYVSGDWVLLTIAAVFLLGIAWTARQGLPRFWSQIKMLLNLGGVRENERIIYNGIPFQVKTLNFYTYLENPALKSGTVRLPLRDLMEMHSRPYHRDEPWFPCREGDWLVLGDGTFGKVILQTPETVRLVKRGGAQKTYPTPDFLGQSPLNLSVGYRLKVTFGVDYAHQAIATDRVPETMGTAVESRLREMGYGDQIANIRAEFESAAASSLDIVVLADFKGAAGPFYNRLRRAIQRICVETCTANGWGIPFSQVTVHMAGRDE